jgi:murein DD-endopeptidase MepM/ murein hydrolase activator NlpD
MDLAIGWVGLRSQPRVIVLALIAIGVAGCSAEPARFSDDPRFETSGAIGAQSMRAPGGTWSWDGGTAITVARGDTVDTIARRHHLPASVIIQANNLAAPNAIHPGQRLVVPRYSTSPTPARPATPFPNVAALLPPESIPTSGGKAAVATGADAPAVAPENRSIKLSRHDSRSSPKAANAQPKGKPAFEPPAKLAAQKPPAINPAEKPAEKPAGVDPVAGADAAPRFHWPVRGQVIASFGPKADGQRNDGIDIAVPENTPIKAADDGVVIYSGNQLKSFGNLVLVRHNDDYVTAYAHAKEVRVKKGDSIRGGEIIGTSGQTGNVDSPQVHFEIRKGSTPVDPMRLLHGA